MGVSCIRPRPLAGVGTRTVTEPRKRCTYPTPPEPSERTMAQRLPPASGRSTPLFTNHSAPAMALSPSATSHTLHPSGSFIAIGSGNCPIISAVVLEATGAAT
jgi:hypothetical protein